MSRPYKFVTDCVSVHPADVDSLDQMIDQSRSITLATFARYVDIRPIEHRLGYSRTKAYGLHLKNDYAVAFYRSEFKGIRVYYMVHSSIEYIYAEKPVPGYQHAENN